MAEPEGMDVDSPAVPSTSSGSNKKRFEVKKWNAVALWAWGKYFFDAKQGMFQFCSRLS